MVEHEWLKQKQPVGRETVFHAIESERIYQARRWGFRQPDGTFEETYKFPDQYLCFMQSYLAEAINQASREPYPNCLATIRKIVTLGVACLEQNGCPIRDWTQAINGHDGKPA